MPPVPRALSRRGIACVIAMLFLVLFSVLALGFYSSVTMSVQVAKNDRSLSKAQLSAESALRFVRYQVARVSMSGGQTPAQAFSSLFTQLDTRLHGSSNLGGHEISQGTDSSGNSVIYIPGLTGTAYNWMSLGSGIGSCRAVLTLNGSTIYLKGVGSDGTNMNEAKAAQFKLVSITSNFTLGAAGLLSNGPVNMSNGAEISGGNVFSGVASGTVPLTMSGGAKIDKNFLYSTNSKAPSLSNGATVAGTIIPNSTATFPTVDVSAFAAYVPSATAALGAKVIGATSTVNATAVLTNIRVKANANFSFGNAQVLNGVIYIEAPNKVTFGGGAKINGIICTDTGSSPTTCTITIGNGVVMNTLATLDPTQFAASENIATLKTLSGALILAPNFGITLQGGTQSFNGAMVAGSFNISNGYGGTVVGGFISTSTATFTMTGGGHITFTGGNTAVPGLTGGASKYGLDLTSYSEVTP